MIVVGAGIVGLTAALELKKSGYDVNVIAQYLPSDYVEDPISQNLFEYTSLWAGAHYRPFPYTSETGAQEQELIKSTYKVFKQLAEDPLSGIRFMTGYDFIERPSTEYKLQQNGYNGEVLEEFKLVDDAEHNYFGASYKAWSLNPPMLLKYLEKKLKEQGVNFVKQKLCCLEEAFEYFPKDIIINCSGRGLRTSSKEPAVYDPRGFLIRGQTLLLKTNVQNTSYYDKTITYQTVNSETGETDWTFLIPRPPIENGIVVLGGTKQLDREFNDKVSNEDYEGLISRGKKYFPELFKDEVKVLKNVVGFRPARNGGFCLNRRITEGVEVIDCYGAGGSGYEMSFGAAQKVIELLKGSK